jgi:hypothetical protein
MALAIPIASPLMLITEKLLFRRIFRNATTKKFFSMTAFCFFGD